MFCHVLERRFRERAEMGLQDGGGLWPPRGLEVCSTVQVTVAVTVSADTCSVCSVCLVLSMDQLRSQVKQEDVQVKEGSPTAPRSVL